MDLLDRIERKRFLGREFLVWLWFESEIGDSIFEQRSGHTFELWLESQITLAFDKEQSRLKGKAPSARSEAREAVRQGKLPIQARLRVTRGEFEYAFLFSADTLGLSSVKIPAQLKDDKHEQFYERMYLLEELEGLLGQLYRDFLTLRLGAAWTAAVLPTLRHWLYETGVDLDGYTAMRRDALAVHRLPPPRRNPATDQSEKSLVI